MTVTIHFAGRNARELVRDLKALAGDPTKVRATSTGVVVDDDVAYTYLSVESGRRAMQLPEPAKEPPQAVAPAVGQAVKQAEAAFVGDQPKKKTSKAKKTSPVDQDQTGYQSTPLIGGPSAPEDKGDTDDV